MPKPKPTTAAPEAATAETLSVVNLPLDVITPSAKNPRKRFKLAELVESIKTAGVFTPILLRANPDYAEGNGRPPYELVAGERRWRASREAGVHTIPAIVRVLSDFQAAEIRLIENVQRESLDPLEDASGLRDLLDESQRTATPLTAEDLAAKVHKSPRWVYQRLALLTLCDEARAALDEERIGASIGSLIADKLPDHDNQRRALKRILEGFNGEPFTYKAASEYIRNEFLLDLAHATFSVTAAYDVAGPCGHCSKRTGANAALFDDVVIGDHCKDAACFQAKTTEARQQLIGQCREAGHEIVQGDKAKKLLSGETTLPGGHFKALEPCPQLTADKRTLFDIFGPNQKGFVTVEHPTTHALVTLVPAKIVRTKLEKLKLLRPVESAPAPAAAPAASAPAQPAKPAAAATAAAKPLTAEQLQQAKQKRAGLIFSRELFTWLAQNVIAADEPSGLVLRSVAAEDILRLTPEARDIVQHLFKDLPSGSTPQARTAATIRYVNGLDGRQLADHIAVIRLAEELSNQDCLDTLEGYSNFAIPMAQSFDLDLEALQANATDTADAEVEAEEGIRLGCQTAAQAFTEAQQ